MKHIIYREDAEERLNARYKALCDDNKKAAAGQVRMCIEDLEEVPVVSTETAEPVRLARKKISVEPFLLGGKVGRDVYRCSACGSRVDRQDRFCRGCGCMLTREETS